jgi:hypothetical protein
VTPEQEQLFYRRRRSRNRLMLGALIALVALFYLIAMARLTRG